MNNTMDLKAHHTIKLQNANNKEPVDNNQYVPKIQECMFHMQLKKNMQKIFDHFVLGTAAELTFKIQ